MIKLGGLRQVIRLEHRQIQLLLIQMKEKLVKLDKYGSLIVLIKQLKLLEILMEKIYL